MQRFIFFFFSTLLLPTTVFCSDELSQKHDDSYDYIPILEKKLPNTIDPMFIRKYKHKHHWRMPRGTTMDIDISYDKNPDGKDWPEATYYKLSKFSVEALKTYTKLLQTGLGNNQCSSTSCKKESETESVDESTNALVAPKASKNNGLMILTKSEHKISDYTKYLDTSKPTGFAEDILNKISEKDSKKTPFGEGFSFTQGNPMARLGLSQLAELIDQIQQKNPNAGNLVVFVAHIPQKDKKVGSKTVNNIIHYQVCQIPPYTLINDFKCIKKQHRNQEGNGLMFLSAGHKEAISKILKDTEKTSFFNFVLDKTGLDSKQTELKLTDIFAFIADKVKQSIENFDYNTDDQFVEDAVFIDNFVESQAELKRNKDNKAISYQSTITSSTDNSKITMKVESEGGEFAKTVLYADEYQYEKVLLTPNVVFKKEALNAGFLPFGVLNQAMIDIAHKTVNYLDLITAYNLLEIKHKQQSNLLNVAYATCSNVQADLEKMTYSAKCMKINRGHDRYVEIDLNNCNLLKGGLKLSGSYSSDYFLECEFPKE
ncbi:hypothetical protein [Endozoicomonas lisbonensis]|uniref:Uncharacterized protein n=1 Tax=Endozoicomonas lisbonensis TaxID=3120522 RepID=A0ABV2SHY6_9GAMM